MSLGSDGRPRPSCLNPDSWQAQGSARGGVSRGFDLVSHAQRSVRRLSAGKEEARINKKQKMARGSGGRDVRSDGSTEAAVGNKSLQKDNMKHYLCLLHRGVTAPTIFSCKGKKMSTLRFHLVSIHYQSIHPVKVRGNSRTFSCHMSIWIFLWPQYHNTQNTCNNLQPSTVCEPTLKGNEGCQNPQSYEVNMHLRQVFCPKPLRWHILGTRFHF